MRSMLIAMLCLSAAIAIAAEQKYPLGHRPPTPEEQAYLDARVVQITRVEPNEFAVTRSLQEVLSGSTPLPERMGIPLALDNSTLKYWPSIYNQRGLNSCAAVHTAFYYSSYLQAQDNDLDITDANPDNVHSPAFAYNLLNGNRNAGTPVPVHIARFNDIGVCSLALMPYDGIDYSTWPSEAAWVDAINNRTKTTYVIDASTPEGVLAVKQHLANGNIAVTYFSVRNTFWNYPNDCDGINNEVLYWQVEGHVGGHGCTIVGYNDDKSYIDHRDGEVHYGAFLCANSWGKGWGIYNTAAKTKGYYWIAYSIFSELLLTPQFGPYVYFNSDRYQYSPRLYAATGINHADRGKFTYSCGIGSPASPLYEGPDALIHDPDNDPDPAITDAKRVAVDLTDGITELQTGASNTIYTSTTNAATAVSNATVTSADFYVDLDKTGTYTVLYSSDPTFTVTPGNTGYAEVELVLPSSSEIWVDASNASGPWDGTEQNPYGTIQDGIDAAVFGDTVIVKDGIYVGAGNKDLTFNAKMITLRSENGPSSTIIDCEGSGRGFNIASTETPETVIDGFTITNGNTWGSGGGIYCNISSPTIKNCVIRGNATADSGGGIYCKRSEATIENCVIRDNLAAEVGGGVCCAEFSEVTFMNALLTGNSCGDRGGGISSVLSGISVNNCTITGNSAVEYGGGVMFSWGSSGTITNSIVRGNAAGEGNQIAVRAMGMPSTASVSYSDVEGGESGVYVMEGCTLDWGDGNIDSDPLFVSGLYGDHYLSQIAAGQGADSPCVDSGSDTAAGLGLDLMTTRTDQAVDAGTVDMGYHYPCSLVVYSIEHSAGAVTIRWNNKAGKSYTVQWSTNIEDWTDVVVGETGEWTDPDVSAYEEKFYKVLEQ